MRTGFSMIRPSATLFALAFAFATGAAYAGEINVTLTGAQETPPVTTTASGSAVFTIGDDKTVSGSVKTTGMDGTAAHIHVGAAGTSGPPVITLTKGGAGVWNVPPGAKLDDSQYQKFKSGGLYVNVHSAAHKGGEIRGQIEP